MKTFHIQFDFLDLINTAEEEEGFRLELMGDGIRAMINDEEIYTMEIWECKHEQKQKETDI